MTGNLSNKILDEYDQEKEKLEKLQDKVKVILKEILEPNKAIIIHDIRARTKSRDSLSKKIDRKPKYSKLSDITDIVGLRVITLFSDTVDEVAKIIKQEFNIDEQNSIDKRKTQEKEPDKFGYLSLHYVAKLSDKRLDITENKIFSDFYFEIQIRSILQHTWAEIEHDLQYKTENSAPKEKQIQRRFYRLAGLLEIADEEFTHIRNDIESYKSGVDDSINEGKLDNVSINIESINQFALQQSLVNEISEAISKRTNVKLYKNSKVEPDTIERLIWLGFENLEQIRIDLEKYKDQIIEFAGLWMNKSNKNYDIFITSEVTFIYLCYVKLALIGDVPGIIEIIKYFSLNIGTQEQCEKFADDILKTYQQIKPSN
jgi:putative GTP pyrophosphokinase